MAILLRVRSLARVGRRYARWRHVQLESGETLMHATTTRRQLTSCGAVA